VKTTWLTLQAESLSVIAVASGVIGHIWLATAGRTGAGLVHVALPENTAHGFYGRFMLPVVVAAADAQFIGYRLRVHAVQVMEDRQPVAAPFAGKDRRLGAGIYLLDDIQKRLVQLPDLFFTAKGWVGQEDIGQRMGALPNQVIEVFVSVGYLPGKLCPV
jgi:hypothetical protein